MRIYKMLVDQSEQVWRQQARNSITKVVWHCDDSYDTGDSSGDLARVLT